jgi:hypothetical protein
MSLRFAQRPGGRVAELWSLGILRFFAFARFCALMPARIFERLSISEAL